MRITNKKIAIKNDYDLCEKNTTLICIDCVDPYRAIKVLEFCKSQVKFKNTLLLTSFDVFYEHLVKIPEIKSIDEYTKFVLRDMDKYFDTEFCLIVQHDGFILNKYAFSAEFFKYDYVGGVTHNGWASGIGGNGGFSLRSKKLTSFISKNYEIISKMKYTGDPKFGNGRNEDVVICTTALPMLMSAGFVIAHDAVQSNFSIDCQPWHFQFGFHGKSPNCCAVWERLNNTTLENKIRSIKRSKKLIDCIIMYNELDMLSLRLDEIGKDVDYVIIVESEVTFTGERKPLYYKENASRYSEYSDKIIHIVVDAGLLSGVENPWEIEKIQRNFAIEYIKNNFSRDDYIICSDIDEIPNIKVVSKYINETKDTLFRLSMSYHLYSIDMCVVGHSWNSAFVSTVAHIMKYRSINYMRFFKSLPAKVVENGGWHFTYVMSVDRIITKLTSFSHVEYSTGMYTKKEYIEECIKNKKFFIDTNMSVTPCGTANLPECVNMNPYKYRDMLTSIIFITE